MTLSLSGEEVIAKAKECYALDLISEATLERVTRNAETTPGYDAILDLPMDWEVEHERELRRRALPRRRRWFGLRSL